MARAKAIVGSHGSSAEAGRIAINGAAARLVEPDDVISVSCGLYDDDYPDRTVLLLDEANRITDRL